MGLRPGLSTNLGGRAVRSVPFGYASQEGAGSAIAFPRQSLDSTILVRLTPLERTLRQVAICNELFEGWPLPEVCRFCHGLGYTGLEIAPFTLSRTIRDLSREARLEIRRIVGESGLSIVGLHWLLARTDGLHVTSSDRSARERALDYLLQLVDLCHDLGGAIMVFGSPQQRSYEGPTTLADANLRMLDILQKLAPRLMEASVTLAIEPLGPEETNYLNTAQDAVELIQAINCDQIRLHLDVKAMSTESASIREIISSNSAWLAHFHANDPNRLGPGMGAVDYREFWPDLIRSYSGWLSVEVFDYSPGPKHIARESIRYLRQLEGLSD